MKRKTNIFYSSGEDSKFLTFSNYTESLTGNFLSTNTKLFPSSFICINIPKLQGESEKTTFIKNYLIGYYENKLSTIRDNVNNEEIYPLSYLIDAINKYDSSFKITYYGNITEQDYQGTFTDIICTIDSAYCETCNINSINDGIINNVIGDQTLRGWTEDGAFIGPSEYNNITPIFDDDLNNYYDTKPHNLLVKSISEENIEFNVLIPLFNMISTDGETEYYDDDINISDTNNHNVPLGIWFADSKINININSKYGQSWSLVIGSQFKPLPTSQKSYSDISKTSNADAYSTFAQVLTKQNNLLDSFYSIKTEIKNLKDRIDVVESGLSIGVTDETLIIGKNI